MTVFFTSFVRSLKFNRSVVFSECRSCPRQAASQSHIPFGSLFCFQGTMKRSFTYSHWQRSNAPPKRENISEWKNLFTHLDKGGRNAHPFSGFFSKIFLRKNLPFTYSHWEKPNAHPKSQKFLFLHLFGIGKPKRTLFLRKNFEKGQKNLPAGSGEQGILAFPYLNIGEKTFNST